MTAKELKFPLNLCLVLQRDGSRNSYGVSDAPEDAARGRPVAALTIRSESLRHRSVIIGECLRRSVQAGNGLLSSTTI